jgi:hypothetical protein
MSRALTRIFQEVRTLTSEERRQLREFLERQSPPSEAARAAALVHQVRGKYAHVPTSSEAFAASKTEEIELENRRTLL